MFCAGPDAGVGERSYRAQPEPAEQHPERPGAPFETRCPVHVRNVKVSLNLFRANQFVNKGEYTAMACETQYSGRWVVVDKLRR